MSGIDITVICHAVHEEGLNLSKYYNLFFFYFAQWGTIVVRSITTMNIIDTDVDIVPESEGNGKKHGENHKIMSALDRVWPLTEPFFFTSLGY